MHKDWSLQCHFLVLKSGPLFLTVVERGRFQTSIMIDLQNTDYEFIAHLRDKLLEIISIKMKLVEI